MNVACAVRPPLPRRGRNAEKTREVAQTTGALECNGAICSQPARMLHRRNEPRKTRNTLSPEPGCSPFRVLRVFRGYHLGCAFATLTLNHGTRS